MLGCRRDLLLLGLFAVGCGDAQVSNQYRGEPFFSVTGALNVSGNIDLNQPFRVALFFMPDLVDRSGLTELQRAEPWVEHLGSSVAVPVPSLYTMNVFDLPGPEHLFRNSDGSDAGWGVGRVLAYVDGNGNGMRDAGEPFVGIHAPTAFYYVRDPLPKEATGTQHALPTGFSLAILPQPCGFVPPPPTDPGTCNVKLGARCDENKNCCDPSVATCGGICLKETKMPWQAGYCTIPEPPTDGCRPAQAVFMARTKTGLTPAIIKQGCYLLPCSSDADCSAARTEDRDQNFYACDLGLGGCRPRPTNISVPIAGRFEVEPFCAPR